MESPTFFEMVVKVAAGIIKGIVLGFAWYGWMRLSIDVRKQGGWRVVWQKRNALKKEGIYNK